MDDHSTTGKRTAKRTFSRGALGVVLTTALLDAVSFSMVMPVMPKLITELTGESLSHAATLGGWLLFVFSVTQFACAPLLGALSDRYGRRPVLLLSLFAFGIDYLIMGLAPTLAWLFLGRVLSGIPGASFTAANAYVADISSPANRAKNFGLIGSAFATGFVIGPAFGGLLGILGSRAPFLAAAGVAFANFTLGYVILRESLPRDLRRAFSWRRANPVGALLQLRKYPQVIGLAGALMLWFLAIQAYPTTWSFYTIFRFGWSEAFVGLSLAAYGAVIAFSQARLTQPVLRRFGERRVAVSGILLGALAYFGQALAVEGWQLFLTIPVWLIASLVMPTIFAMMSRQIPPDGQGELQGANASLISVSAIIGPLLMAQLFGTFTAPQAPVFFPGAGFFVGGLISIAAAALVVRALKRTPTAQIARSSEPLVSTTGARTDLAAPAADFGRGTIDPSVEALEE